MYKVELSEQVLKSNPDIQLSILDDNNKPVLIDKNHSATINEIRGNIAEDWRYKITEIKKESKKEEDVNGNI